MKLRMFGLHNVRTTSSMRGRSAIASVLSIRHEQMPHIVYEFAQTERQQLMQCRRFCRIYCVDELDANWRTRADGQNVADASVAVGRVASLYALPCQRSQVPPIQALTSRSHRPFAFVYRGPSFLCGQAFSSAFCYRLVRPTCVVVMVVLSPQIYTFEYRPRI